MQLSDLRKEYTLKALDLTDVSPDPFGQFKTWLDEAVAAGLPEPTAMNLATASPEGKPSARIVLLKGMDNAGFTFFTNYNSHKGKDILKNPYVALTFHWTALERQVRIEGKAEWVSAAASEAYFHSRPRSSQIGAWVSPQSEVLSDRHFLETETQRLTRLYENSEIPLPPHWGGFLVKPEMIEFWQGRPSRLHDRLAFYLEGTNWLIRRLAP